MSKHILFSIFVVLTLIGCCKTSFKIGEDQWPIVSSGSVSEEAFKEAIVGYGWKAFWDAPKSTLTSL